jgi:hypothetical protein
MLNEFQNVVSLSFDMEDTAQTAKRQKNRTWRARPPILPTVDFVHSVCIHKLAGTCSLDQEAEYITQGKDLGEPVDPSEG